MQKILSLGTFIAVVCLFTIGAADKTERKAGELLELELKGVKWKFHWCPAGTFTIGSPKSEKGRAVDDTETQYKVTLTQGFYMAETECTQEQWQAVMGSNPSHFKGAKLPVEMVCWGDCKEFVRTLNKLNVAPAGYKFALPTEARWEYACRAGTTTAYCFGDNEKQLNDCAWYSGHSEEETYSNNEKPPYRRNINDHWQRNRYSELGLTTHEVGTKKPNAWGLYDMHGNVWEWCDEDVYNDYAISDIAFSAGVAINWVPVYRGGSWGNYAEDCRSAVRSGAASGHNVPYLGLRVALVAEKEITVPQIIRTELSAKAGDLLELELKGVKWKFHWCPAGTFIMGSPESEEGRVDDRETQHQVTLTQGFYMAEMECTQAQWQAVMGKNPSHFVEKYRKRTWEEYWAGGVPERVKVRDADLRLPVEQVSWDDCQGFVKKLNVLKVAPTGFKFALPTEAQWEYACRAGSKTAYCFSDDADKLVDYALV